MSRGQMSLNEDNDGQRKGSASEVELGIVRAENQEDELNREADPEEQVELDETEENLVVGEHGLDPAVCAQELIDLPAELGIDLPSQCDVGNLGDGDDNRNNDGESVD